MKRRKKLIKSSVKINASFFKAGFKESLKYISENRRFIYAVIILFILAVITGLFISPTQGLIEQFTKYLKELIDATKDLNTSQLIIFIFKNNVVASFLGLFLGIIFGIFPIILCVLNGYILGYVSRLAISEEGIWVLWRLFPHGVFELPAVLISLGLGVKLGFSLFGDKKSIVHSFKSSVKAFLLVILPLLIIAAIIEGILISFLG